MFNHVYYFLTLNNMNLTKGELVDVLAKSAGTSKAAAAKGLNGMLDAVVKALSKGGKVTIPGFGTWKVVARKARNGVNPRTGATIKIAARKVVRWRTGKALADKVK